MTTRRTAVLLMAYGAAESLDDIPRYLQDIRGNQPVLDVMVRSLTERYRKIGGSSPLVAITLDQAAALQRMLDAQSGGYRVYAGMHHSSPTIKTVLAQIVADGYDTIVAMALTPYNSMISLGAYFACLDAALAELDHRNLKVLRVDGFHDQPLLIESFVDRIREAAQDLSPEQREEAALLLSAHSLPERIKDEGDLYPGQVEASARLIAGKAGFKNWHFAYQSRPEHAREPWLGPETGEVISELIDDGIKALVISPVGFVSDHLETLFDIEVMFGGMARQKGVAFRRAEALNTHPKFIESLAAVIRAKAEA